MMRGGHLDLAILGAYEVAANGDLANWTRADPGTPPAVGGAMELAFGARARLGADGAHHARRPAAAARAAACR